MVQIIKKLEKKALDLESFIRKAKRKLLEFEILLSERDYQEGRFKIYRKSKDLLKKL